MRVTGPKVTNSTCHLAVLYEESFEHSINGGYSLQNNTVVDVWLSQAELMKVITAGYRYFIFAIQGPILSCNNIGYY